MLYVIVSLADTHRIAKYARTYIRRYTHRENGKNLISFRVIAFVASDMVGHKMGRSAPHQCR